MGPQARIAHHPTQGPGLVEGRDFTAPVAEVAVKAQRLLQVPGRARGVTGQRWGRRLGEVVIGESGQIIAQNYDCLVPTIAQVQCSAHASERGLLSSH